MVRNAVMWRNGRNLLPRAGDESARGQLDERKADASDEVDYGL